MPIYDYRCQKCGSDFDKFVRNDQKEGKITCPFCKSEDVVKIVSKPANSNAFWSYGGG